MLIGGPDSGKTNYLARLWAALRSRAGVLQAPAVPTEIKYVEEALAHLLQGQFAPRSEKTLEEGQSFAVPVVASANPSAGRFQIIVPDVVGELWKRAVETSELPEEWMNDLASASGALLFVRIGSDQNVEPLDWVTVAKFLRMEGAQQGDEDAAKREIPTQVSLCELLRFMEHGLGTGNGGVRPRVAVLITAWDRLDAERAAAGPTAYLAAEYPLLAGRLKDISKFDIRVFGVSVVGGDFVDEDFRQSFFKQELKSAGYVVEEKGEHVERKEDITLPVAWVVKAVGDP
ncbi:MAG: hypothetical protein WAV27_24450 [Xanthobacteraceae bacterium]